MMPVGLELSAQLLLTVGQDNVMVVAEEQYVLVNFQDHAALERVAESFSSPSSKPSSGGLSALFDKAREINQVILQLGLILDVRVNNKTYIEFGVGPTPRYAVGNALFGKLGSLFKGK
ncbi:hypothetical protein GU926_03370 [Nibribacter ruber]|uniref:Uncharacterized protein n=1 Tax=Nibribacter ruber TaxID=2698458 RepID=A0A6P1NXX1_9BACT|nr:hypothetical protein [Nibribacter ruber]QHL86531.1 hypothetical protein GU926_03370 [Nibribacter ruber]